MTHRSDFIPTGFVAVTPSDTVQVNFHGLMIGAAGNVAVVDALGVTTVIPVIAGQTISGQICVVKATGTTATGITGLVP